jgi:DNA segregation ATPase FtsK/SpoIIIE, S-DNA-T family
VDVNGNLPAVPDDGDLEPEYIFEGEIVGEPEPAPKPPAVVQVFQTITVVVQHPVPRTAARHAGYVPAGVVVAWRRWRHARQRPERMMRMAEAAGDHAQVIAWRQQLEQEKQNRHGRIVKSAETVVTVARNSLLIAGAAFGAGLVLSILLSVKWGLRGFEWPWETAAGVAVAVVSVAGAVWIVMVAVFGVTVFGVLHELGRRGGDLAPGWLAASSDADVEVLIDERAVTQALRQLNLKPISDHLKGGAPLAFIVPCRIEGRGTYCEIRLPGGLPAIEITKQKRREGLAAGLYRHTKEVWPSVGSDNSILKLWAADKGALDEGAGPYPLLEGGFADVFKGLPFGRSLRGDPVKLPFMGRNTLCGGAPEQGKSNGARVVAAGCTLDLVVEMRLYIPDTNFDFERFRPRTARYVMGAEDEHLERILGDLEELKDELQSRGQLLVDMEQEEVTYQLAHAGIGLHPLFVLVEEAHIVIQHRRLGKDFQQLLCDIVKLDRKRGVHLMLSTQAPTKDSMPRDVTRNCTNGIAYAVGDHVANDALLGQGAYRAGHRATELIPGADRGTALCKGFSGEARSEMVQAHRVSGREGDDQVTPLVRRALEALAGQGRAVPGTDRPLAITSRDLLADVLEVAGPDRVRLADLPPRLRKLAPSWLPYRSMNGTVLRQLLAAENVRTTNPGNVPTLDPADLLRAIRAREDEVS